ncbi:MAG TPA: hypothetical protein VGJ78_06485 [Vicinamibacterales bacterium]
MQRAVRAEIRLETQEGMLADRQISRSVRDEDKSAQLREFWREIAEQIDRRDVGPLDVVEEQHHWARARQLLQESRHFAHQALGRPASGVGEQSGGRRFVGGHGRNLDIPARSDLLHQRGNGRIALEQAVERFEKRQVRLSARQAL